MGGFMRGLLGLRKADDYKGTKLFFQGYYQGPIRLPSV